MRSISRACCTEPGSLGCDARKSKWWAASGMMIIVILLLLLRKTPPPLHGSSSPLLNTIFEADLGRKFTHWLWLPMSQTNTSFMRILEMVSSIDCGGQVLIRTHFESCEAIIWHFVEIPFRWREHIFRVTSFAAHRHHHLCARLVIPAMGIQLWIVGWINVQTLDRSRVIRIDGQRFLKSL